MATQTIRSRRSRPGRIGESAAARINHSGRVTQTEAGDEESEYEVEVTLDDGTQVDVQLDADFEVVGTESDDDEDESGGEQSGDD